LSSTETGQTPEDAVMNTATYKERNTESCLAHFVLI
jgi:hypothetical protein